MNKVLKTVGITAALAVMIPLSAYAATSTTTDSTTSVTTTQDGTKPAGHEGRGGFGGKGGFGGQYINDDVLTLLNLDRAALQEKLAAGSTLVEVATAQGVTEEQLKAALTTAFEAKQAEEKENFTTNLDSYISTKQEQKAERAKGGFGFGGSKYLSTAATTLGLTEDELKTELTAGKTIADVASDKSVDVNTVVTAIASAINAQIDQAVTDGKLTEAQATDQKATSTEQAEKIVNGEFGGKGFGGGRHGGKGMKDAETSETNTTTDSTSTSA
ncbi:uncharacterized protein YidB (DUF937 family) [Paenibacillus phyllosphaerae]|uniref:Uncharacterized protein YidB (DUF937 family) n=1 Tax=Paenibacillus phyllosphaerae TaxID=274593 RepID=A0A7W5B0I3_9BACL|nr:hypothetical protein [Paenibacillus phyllosphaerae]MBB3112174.1 uncharacterized protein YidB (DUF937 family) [Paenibacillus phyllosphaerae]